MTRLDPTTKLSPRQAELAREFWDPYRRSGAVPFHAVAVGLHLTYRQLQAALGQQPASGRGIDHETATVPADAAYRLLEGRS